MIALKIGPWSIGLSVIRVVVCTLSRSGLRIEIGDAAAEQISHVEIDWQLRCQPSIGITRKIRKVLCPKPGADAHREAANPLAVRRNARSGPLSAAKQFASRVQLIENRNPKR